MAPRPSKWSARMALRSALAAVALAVALAACSSSADELLENARFEELQRNVPHAQKLYQQIIDRFPNTHEAAEAKTRLAFLATQPATP
jgi:TolA-binding protein